MSNERVLGIDYGTDGGTSIVLVERRSDGGIQVIDMISVIGSPLSAQERKHLQDYAKRMRESRTTDIYAKVAAGMDIHTFLAQAYKDTAVYGRGLFAMPYGEKPLEIVEIDKHHPKRKTQPNRGPRGNKPWNS